MDRLLRLRSDRKLSVECASMTNGSFQLSQAADRDTTTAAVCLVVVLVLVLVLVLGVVGVMI